jgi:flagellar biosynthetic protein FlhB
MAENANGAEKTELPTPKRLEDARGEGQVAFSQDFTVGAGMVAAFALLIAFGSWFMTAMSDTMRWSVVDAIHIEIDDREALRSLIMHHLPIAMWLAALVASLVLLNIAVGLMQVGFAPTLKPLIPKFEKLSPLAGFKRILGMRGLIRTVFSMLKLALVGVIAWQAIAGHLASDTLVTTDLGKRLHDEASSLAHLGMLLAVVLLIIGILDLMFQRWQMTRDLMMTKQEIKEEYKQSEGDPLVRGKIKQIQRKLAMSRMMQEVPKADVVITNPTHVAVALKYDKASMAAPVVLAKGYDDVAQRIKAIAAQHDIPMVENVPLARALAKDVEVGKPISTKWYQAVAEVLALVYKIKERARAG